MGMLDDARRKMKDWTTSDENIQGSPKTKIKELSEALSQLTPQERQRNIEHIKAYLDYYYVAHQGEKKIPVEVHKEFSKMVEQSNRLTAVENARMVLQQYGGPPTRETIENSLERSANQRAREFSQYRVEPLTSREMSWRDLQPQQDRKQEQAQTQTQERTQIRAAEISHTPAPSSIPQTRIEVAPSLSQQTVTEPARQPVTVEAARQPVQQFAAEPMRANVETVKSPQQTVTEPTKSPQEMSKEELRAKMDQLDQRVNDLRAQSKTVPVAELSAVRETIKNVQAELGKYDTELAGRLEKEFRGQRQGPVQEPSWKDLHPKQEQAQGQKQGHSQEHKHEQQQSRSRSQGVEISV